MLKYSKITVWFGRINWFQVVDLKLYNYPFFTDRQLSLRLHVGFVEMIKKFFAEKGHVEVIIHPALPWFDEKFPFNFIEPVKNIRVFSNHWSTLKLLILLIILSGYILKINFKVFLKSYLMAFRWRKGTQRSRNGLVG